MKNNPQDKRALQFGFVMDPMEDLVEGDSSSVIMMEAQNRRHQIWYIEPNDLRVRNDSVWAEAKKVFVSEGPKFRILDRKEIDLGSLDLIFNRKDPPFDVSYLHLTQILELLTKRLPVVNHPAGVRKANEKLYILEFPKWIPPTLVTKNPAAVEQFQNEIKDTLILKPLDQKGGTGIRLLPFRSKTKKRTIHLATQSGNKWIMAQKFLKINLESGDKRILFLNGKVIGQYRKIPKSGEFRANIARGGRCVRASLTERERRMARELGPKFVRDGLDFVGIDVVDSFLIEINVTSPAGLTELTELEGQHPEGEVVNFLEARVFGRSR